VADEGRIELTLVADAQAPRRARAAVGRALAGLPGDVGFRARLLVSELVANSVQHAAADAEAAVVRVRAERLGGALRVEVSDDGPPFDSEVRRVSERATSGRGLALVDALVDRWGTEHGQGNLVWFEIDDPAGGARDPHGPPRPGMRARPQAEEAGADERVGAAALLARAAQLVREGWSQQADARDLHGVPVEPWDEAAAAWSLLGAIVAALDGPGAVAEVGLPELARAMTAIAELIEERSLQGWNDAPTRTQREVVSVLERARLLLLGRVPSN
jgi:anti-sigma regulatory factor (Ser/Thr protein kinase)